MSSALKNKLPTFKKLIFDELRINALSNVIQKIKSVRYSSYSMGDSVNVYAEDLTKPERESLKSILKQFDSASSSQSTSPRTASYVFLHHEFSSEVKEKVKKDLAEQFLVTDYTTAWNVFHCDYETALYRALIKLEEF